MHFPTLAELPQPPRGRAGWPWTGNRAQQRDEWPSSKPAISADGESWPRTSIVTPTYNQGQFIEATIRSILLQGYPNLEYIIIDGGSTDDTVDIIKKYEPWLDFWVSETDRGQAHAINKGLAKASGEILGWLNSDDILLPGAIAHVARMRDEYPEAVAWVGGCQKVDPVGRILSTNFPKGLGREDLADWGHNHFNQASCFFANSAWEQVGALDERLHFLFDLDLWIKLSAVGSLMPTSKVLSAATIHKDAKTQAYRPDLYAERIVVQVNHGYLELAMSQLVPLFTRRSLKSRVWRRLKLGFVGLVQGLVFRKRIYGSNRSSSNKTQHHSELTYQTYRSALYRKKVSSPEPSSMGPSND